MRQRESLVDVLGLLVAHRRLWLGITAAAFVLSLVVAFISPVYYTAITTFLAASPDLNNASKLFAAQEVQLYGTGNDVERVLAAAESEETIGYLIDTFDLYAVYDIDRDGRYASTTVRDELLDHYSVRRTKYDEITISVEDKEPRRAAAMANVARERAGSVIQHTTLRGQREMYKLYERAVNVKTDRLASITDSLNSISTQYGILDAVTQGQEFAGLRDRTSREIIGDSTFVDEFTRRGVSGRLRDTLTVVQARLAAAKVTRRLIGTQLDQYTLGNSRARTLTSEYTILNEQLSYDRERMRRIETIMASPGPVIYVSNAARVPDRKSRPVRWLIVVGITSAAAVFGAVGILLWDTYKGVEWDRYTVD